MGDGTSYQTENVTHQFSSPDDYNVSLSMSVPICTGILEIAADGGVPPYEFEWSNGFSETSDSLSIQDSLCPGIYHILITDAMGETLDHSIVLSDLTGQNLTIDLEYENCLSAYPDSCIGSVNAIPQGGTPPYTWEWNTGASTQEITDLCAGTYSVTICDANNICKTSNIELPVYECGITSYIAPDNFTSCNGYILFEINGGEFPYSYNWTPEIDFTGTQTSTFSDTNLCADVYFIEATDALGNTCHDEIKISPLMASPVILQRPNIGQCNGKLQAKVNYGTPPYTFNWSNGENTSTIENLCSGWYHFTVCDSRNICVTDSIELTYLPLSNNINWRGPSGPGACDGYIYNYASGGVPPYSFSWNPVQNSLDGYDFTIINDLCEGTYILTTCDNQDSCIVDTLYLTDKPFNISIGYTNPKNGLCNGKINTSVVGAAPPYNFIWSNGDECLYQTECNLSNLCPGTYYVTICDFENNCAVDSVTLYELPPGPEIININRSLSSPESACNASAIIEAQGQEPFTFHWSTAYWSDETLSGIEDQCPGTYYYTVCDANNICIHDSIILSNLSGQFELVNNPYNSQCNGKLSYQAFGAYPPYQYNWSNGEDQNSTEDLCPGWYYITATDLYGNQYVDSLELTNQSIPPLVSVYNTAQSATISGYCTASADQDISTDFFTSIRGHVYFGETLLPQGVMLFYTKEGSKYTARQVCEITAGNYRIESLRFSSYYVLAIPIFTPGFEYFPVYYPSYFGNVLNVESSTEIALYDTVPKDIYLEKSEIIQHGSHEIKGKLIVSPQAVFETNIFMSPWYDLDPPGIPQAGSARHIPVYLRNENQDLIKYQLTDHNGEFHFKHLADGKYSLHFEKAGYTTNYNLHESSDTISEIIYAIYASEIALLSTNMDELSMQAFSVYPNPADDKCYIQLNEYLATNIEFIRIKIYGMDGKLLLNLIEKQPSNHIITIDLSQLPKGIFILKGTTNSGEFTQKLIHK